MPKDPHGDVEQRAPALVVTRDDPDAADDTERVREADPLAAVDALPVEDGRRTDEYRVAPPPVAEGDFYAGSVLDRTAADSREARELVAEALRELEAAPGTPQEARIHAALGVIFERRLNDLRRAIHHYQQAYRLAPQDLASIRAARQIFWLRQNWAMVLTLLDAELRVVESPTLAAQLLVEKGQILEDWLANPRAAEEAYTAALARDPGAARALHCLRRLHRQRGDTVQLIEIDRRAISTSRDHRSRSQIFCEIARLSEDQGDLAAAIEAYSASFIEDPASSAASAALKRLYHREQRWGDLVDVVLTEAELASTMRRRAFCFFVAARLCRDRLHQPDRALELFAGARTALRDDGERRGAESLGLQEMIELLQQTGRFAELVEVYEELIDALPDAGERVVAHYHLGQLLEERLARETEALWHYRHAIALDPTYVPALQSLGRLYQRRGMWGDLVAMQAAEAEALGDPAARAHQLCAVADLCETRLQDLARAVEFHRRALTACPNHPIAERALVRLYVKAENWPALLPLLEAQLRRASGAEAVRLHSRLAQLHEDRLGDAERAIHHCERALALQPDDPVLLEQLARLYREAERYEQLVAVLDRAAQLATDPTLVLATAHQAAELCEQKLDQQDEALRRYRALLERQPGDRATLRSLGRLLHRRGDWAGLLALYESELRSADPTGERAALLWYKIGELQEQRLGEAERAVDAYQAATAAADGFRPALQALARLHRARGEWEALFRVMERTAALVSDTRQRAGVLYAIGELWELHLARTDRALQHYRQAFDAAPDHGPARDALVRLLITTGSAADAAEVLEHALRHSVDEESRALILKQLAELRGRRLLDIPGAIACYEGVLVLSEEDPEALEALSRLYRRGESYARLAEIHERLASIAEDPAAAIGHLREAASVIEVHLQPDSDPAPIFERIAELDRGDRGALEALARIYNGRDEHVAVLGVYRRLLASERVPEDRRALLLHVAAASERAGDLAGAATALADAAALEEDWLVVRELRRVQEQRGVWEDVSAALAREAELCHDSGLAVQCLLRAAELYRDRFEDLDAAARALEQLLALEPLHEEAAAQLEHLLVKRGDWQRLVDTARRRLQTAQLRGETRLLPQIELLARIAWIQREHLQQPAEAVTTLAAAVRLDPNHLPTLLTLGELHVSLEQWQEAVEVFSRVVALSDDPELLQRAHFQLGVIWSEPLSDRREAISCFQNVLAVAPDHREAMQRLYDLFVWCRDWENAADIAMRMIDSEPDPARQVASYVELADIYEGGFGDPQLAAEHLSHALAINPLDEAVVGRLADLHARLGQWEAVCAALRAYLDALPPDAQRQGRKRRIQLGEVLHQRLGRAAEALAEYRRAVSADPADVETRLAGARIIAQEGHFEEAVSEHRAILAIDPLHAENLRQLRSVWSRAGTADAAGAAAAVLAAFGLASEAEQRLAREYRTRSGRAPAQPLDPAVYDARVAQLAPYGAGWTVLSLLSEVASRLRPPSFDHWQVTKTDRLPPRSDDPLKVIVREVRGLLTLPRDVEVYVSPTRSREIDLLLTDPPSLVAGSSVMSALPSREIRFAVALHLSYISSRCWIAHHLDAHGLAVLIHGACRFADPGHEVALADEPEVSEMARMIQRTISRRSRRALEEACNELTSRPMPPFERWAVALQAMVLRSALWVVDDFEAALGHLRRHHPELASPDAAALAAEVRKQPLAAELIRYWLSDDYFLVRRTA